MREKADGFHPSYELIRLSSFNPLSLALEVKEGAYIPTPEEDFAPWSPAENTEGAAAYLAWMRDAQPA